MTTDDLEPWRSAGRAHADRVLGPIDRCYCNHPAYLHTPTGRMDNTKERGTGKCTAGPWGHLCPCDDYQKKGT